MEEFRCPENVCFRFARANGTRGIRLDIYEASDGFFNNVADQGSYVRKIGRSIFLEDENALQQPLSAFIENVYEATRYGVRR